MLFGKHALPELEPTGGNHLIQITVGGPDLLIVRPIQGCVDALFIVVGKVLHQAHRHIRVPKDQLQLVVPVPGAEQVENIPEQGIVLHIAELDKEAYIRVIAQVDRLPESVFLEVQPQIIGLLIRQLGVNNAVALRLIEPAHRAALPL